MKQTKNAEGDDLLNHNHSYHIKKFIQNACSSPGEHSVAGRVTLILAVDE